MVQHKLNFFLNTSRTALNICFYRSFKKLKSCLCVVKSFNCLKQCIGRIVGQKILEISKCHCCLIELIRILYLIITARICNKNIGSPVISKRILIIWFSIQCRNYIQRFSVWISSFFYNFFAKIGSHSKNILHKLYRVLEYIFIHFLKNDLQNPHAFYFKCQQICIINVSISKWYILDQSSFILKMCNCFCLLRSDYLCHNTSSRFYSKILLLIIDVFYHLIIVV